MNTTPLPDKSPVECADAVQGFIDPLGFSASVTAEMLPHKRHTLRVNVALKGPASQKDAFTIGHMIRDFVVNTLKFARIEIAVQYPSIVEISP